MSVSVTNYGFEWQSDQPTSRGLVVDRSSLVVERTASAVVKGGVYKALTLRTPRMALEIEVSPSGLMKVARTRRFKKGAVR